jgi:hypothetical protein
VSVRSLVEGTSQACRRCAHRKHGSYGTQLYGLWRRIKIRCTNPNAVNWADYGGRGILLHAAWHDFTAFEAWVVEHLGAPEPGRTIDRINNDGHYEPGNVRWATPKEQARNRRSNRVLTHPVTGETMLLCEWADRLGIKLGTLHARITRYGWSLEQALSGRPRRT